MTFSMTLDLAVTFENFKTLLECFRIFFDLKQLNRHKLSIVPTKMRAVRAV